MPKNKKQINKKENVETSDLNNHELAMPSESVELDVAPEEHKFVKKDLKKKKRKGAIVDKPEEKEPVEKKSEETPLVFNGARKNDQEIEAELNEIYSNGDGTMPDMSNFEKKKHNRLFTAVATLVISCLFLAAVAWAGFFMFQPQSRFSEEDVILSVSGDEEVIAGQETHYRVRYRNAQNVPLAKVSLQVRYPEGFVFERAEPVPTNDKNDEWILNSLEEQASGYIDVWGKMYGDLEKKQSFRVFLNYIPSNFSAEFQKVATLSTQVMDSPVSLSVVGPAQASVGGETELTVVLENKNSSSTENLALVMEPGDYFTIKSSEPKADEGNQYQWSIAKLEGKREIKISGVFGETLNEEKAKIIFKLLSWKDGDRSVEGYVIQNFTQETAISKTEVSANLVINGTVSNFSIQPAEVLNSSVVIKNNGGSVIKNISARVVFDAPAAGNKSLLKWESLADEADGKIVGEQISTGVRRGSIEWTSRQVPALGSLDPGEEVIIDFSLPLKSAEDIDLTDFVGYEIMSGVEIKYEKDNEQKILSSNQIKLLVNSDVTVGVQDEKSMASGKTKHEVTWIVNNSFHELKDIVVEADLYGDISWQASDLVVPAGEASYDTEKQKVTWRVGSMPTSLDVLALQFAVVINRENPSQTNLASKVRFTAIDVVTGETITIAGDEVLLN
jgi:hypothetical protein